MSSDDDLPKPRRVQSPTRARLSLKKRAYGASYASAQSNSSDGPFFSSDDLEDASAENYASPRRKKQFKRTWWQPESSASSRDYDQARRETKLPKDSGVFMSDNSSNDDGFSVAPLSSPPRGTSRHDPRFSVFKASMPASARDDSDARAFDLVASTIDDCLESGSETVDLSSCLLGTVPNELLLRLQHLIRPPRLVHAPPDEESYQSLAPSIKLYLSSNALRVFPAAIGYLENISVLSLRNNKISELPSSIGNLHNLVELNLAGNRLRWLPYELLKLTRSGQLANITLVPNPLLKPFQTTEYDKLPYTIRNSPNSLSIDLVQNRYKVVLENLKQLDDINNGLARATSGLLKKWYATSILLELAKIVSIFCHEDVPEELERLRHDILLPIHLGNSSVSFLELDGCTPVRSSPAPPSSIGVDVSVVPLTDQPSQTSQDPLTSFTSRTPSLFELSIRACVQAAPVDDLLTLLPEETPDSVRQNLERARRICETGRVQCSTCQREYVIPRAEWLEYWHVPKDRVGSGDLEEDNIVPFLRRTCSWACAKPTATATRRYRRKQLAWVDVDLEYLG